MSLIYGGKLSLSAIVPIVGSATAAAFADLNAQMTGAVSLQASLSISPPTVAQQITFLTGFLAQLNAGVSLGLPAVSFDLAATASLIASLTASLAVLTTLNGLLATAGIYAYEYSGAANALGAALTTELATQWPDAVPSSGSTNALILGTTSSATWTAMSTFFSGA